MPEETFLMTPEEKHKEIINMIEELSQDIEDLNVKYIKDKYLTIFSQLTGYTKEEILSEKRRRELVSIRHCYWTILRHKTVLTLKDIGISHINDYHYSTIISGITKFEIDLNRKHDDEISLFRKELYHQVDKIKIYEY